MSATATPKPVMVRCKSVSPEWQRHKGTQEQPPGLGWAAVGAISAGWHYIGLHYIGLHQRHCHPQQTCRLCSTVFGDVVQNLEREMQAMLYKTQKMCLQFDCANFRWRQYFFNASP